MVRFIKKLLLGVYDRLTARKCTISIGDIINQRDEIEHNQFLSVTRMLDIKACIEEDNNSFEYQNIISRLAYGEKHREEQGNRSFIKLIESYKKNGYIKESALTIDKEFRLLDGNHRMGMSLYMGFDEVTVRVLKRKSKNPRNIDWYMKKGIGTDDLYNVIGEFNKIQEKLRKEGNIFCCITDLKSKNILKDLELLVKVKSIYKYEGGKKTEFPISGYLIQFLIPNPCYQVCTWGGYESVQIKRIKEIMINRYSDSTFYFSVNCLEGKRIFTLMEPYLKK